MVGGIGTDVISLKNFRRRVRRTNNFLISYILIFICIALLQYACMHKVFILLCYFYFGIVLRRQYCGIDCVFYCLGRSVRRSLVSLAEVLILAVTCFLSCCEISMKRSFCESLRDFKSVAFVLTVGFIYKIFAFFRCIKILTAVI